MRLRIFVLLSVVLVMALGMGCGGGGSSSGGSSGGNSAGGGSSTPSVAGTWNLVSGGSFPSQIVFNSNGTGSVSTGGIFTWIQQGGQVNITTVEGSAVGATTNGNTLALSEGGGTGTYNRA